jgi:hypothetical protein
MLNSSIAEAFDRKIVALIPPDQEDLGYDLHRAVQRVKCDLSVNTAAAFHFSDGVHRGYRPMWNEAVSSGSRKELGQIRAASTP